MRGLFSFKGENIYDVGMLFQVKKCYAVNDMIAFVIGGFCESTGAGESC